MNAWLITTGVWFALILALWFIPLYSDGNPNQKGLAAFACFLAIAGLTVVYAITSVLMWLRMFGYWGNYR